MRGKAEQGSSHGEAFLVLGSKFLFAHMMYIFIKQSEYLKNTAMFISFC